MILLILIINYLTINLKKEKKYNIINTQNFVIANKKELFFDLSIISLFLLFYVFLFRILKLLKDIEYINLVLLKNKAYIFLVFVTTNYNIVLLIILIITCFFFFFFLKKYVAQNLKISFFRLIMYFLVKNDKFLKIYAEVITWQSTFWYWLVVKKLKLHNRKNAIFFYKYNAKILYVIYFFFKYLSIILGILFFICDLYLNKYNLVIIPQLLPWLGLYQLMYNINSFINTELDLRYDLCFCDWCYGVNKFNIQEKNFDTVIELTKYLEKLFKF